MKTLEKVSDFVGKYMAAIVIVVAALALLFPGTFSVVKTAWVNTLLGIVMFGMGLTLKPEDFKVVFSRPKDVIIGCIAQFTLMPFLAWALTQLFHLPTELAIGVILLGGSMLFRESLPPRRRAGQSLLRTFGNFGTILRNKHFILYVLQLGFAQGILFSNIASSPFIIQEHYGFSALEFSIVFAVNSLAFMAAAPLSLRFRRPQDGIMASCIGMCVLSVAELAALWCGCGFWVYEGILFLLLFTMALTFTLSTTLAMESERRYAGSASAILGAVCFAFGGIVSPIVGTGDILKTTGIVFVVCAAASLCCAIAADRQHPTASRP